MTEAQTITETTAIQLLQSTQRLEVLLTTNKEREAWKYFLVGVLTALLVAILIVIIASTMLTSGVRL